MYIRIKLGDKERGLSFKMGTLRHIGEITKADPLDFTTTTDVSNQYNFVKTVVWAALLTNCDLKGIEPDFSEKDVTAWVDALSVTEAGEITNAFAKAFSGRGEADDDTRKEQTNMG